MTPFYVGLVDKGGEGWGVTFPNLPGCTSAGHSMADLFATSIEAIGLWADAITSSGGLVPEPRSMDDLLADPEVKNTLKEIGPVSFLQVPLLVDAGRVVRANVSFDAALLDAIDAAAKRRGVTRSTFLAAAARDKIAQGI